MISSISSPAHPLVQHNAIRANGLTAGQLKRIHICLEQAFENLNIVFHLLPQEVHDLNRRFNEQYLLGYWISDMFELFKILTLSLQDTFEKGRLMAVAFEKVNASADFRQMIDEGSYLTPDRLRALFSEVVQQFHDNLAALREGELLILPAGTYKHSIAYVIKVEKDVYTFSIINTGLGAGVLGNLNFDESANQREVDGEAPTFDIPKEVLLESPLIDHILRFAYETRAGDSHDNTVYRANFKRALTKFYRNIQRLFLGCREYKLPHFMQTSGQGTCSATCLHAALELFAPPGTEMYNLTYAKKALARIDRDVSDILHRLDPFKTMPEVPPIILKAGEILRGAADLRGNLEHDPKYADVWEQIDVNQPIPQPAALCNSTEVFPPLNASNTKAKQDLNFCTEGLRPKGSPLQPIGHINTLMSPAESKHKFSVSEAVLA